jgi:predicted small secreted protein
MSKFMWVVAAFAMLAAAGCNTMQPVQDVVDAPITSPGKPLTMAEVQRAIERAGAGLGWQIKPVKPGQLTGQLDLRTHRALVDITHNTKTYNIKYRDSTDLGAKDGQIHRNYNGWVQNLDKAIRAQLSVP